MLARSLVTSPTPPMIHSFHYLSFGWETPRNAPLLLPIENSSETPSFHRIAKGATGPAGKHPLFENPPYLAAVAVVAVVPVVALVVGAAVAAAAGSGVAAPGCVGLNSCAWTTLRVCSI